MELHVKIYFSVFSILILINHVKCQDILVEISQGILRGRTATNMDGGTFYSFQSIPFAEPPINELRFKAPVAANGWEEIRNATTDVPRCFQSSDNYGAVQEDCLYLNVFTPELPSKRSTLKTVMVNIHGGGFDSGSSHSSDFGPEFLLTKDIVLVTINYRVGIFGFLNLNDPELEVPGNAGMKDQVLALTWVKNNIERFGGDPNDITIFGESAGGMSVHFHILSPMSAGLFNKAIPQSGTALMTLLGGTRNSGEVLARQLGIQTEDWSEMLNTLRELPPEELLAATRDIVAIAEYEQFTTPIIEEPSNEPAFLSNRPIDTIRSGNYNHVPIMIGNTDAEGLLYQFLSLLATGENMLIEDFTYFVPSDFELTPGSENETIVSQKIKEFYYGDTEPTREDIAPAVHLYGDFVFGFPAYRSALEHLKTLSAPIFFYTFEAETSLNLMKQAEPRLQSFPGAAHADELGYLYHNQFTPSVIVSGGIEDLAIRNMVNLWTNFAIYGNPTPDDSGELVWEPVSETTFNYVRITTNSTFSDIDPNPINIQFWYDLYQVYFPIN